MHAARNGFYYALDRTNGSFVAGKQYVDQLNWTTGLDPKTGRPLNYNPNTDVQDIRAGQPRLAREAEASERLCPSHFGGKNWEPGAYNPELNLLYIPSIEGCNTVETVEQKDFVDQGGTVKSRERFAGGGGQADRAALRQPQGGRSGHRRDQGRLKLEYPNYSGALATAGNLVFIGQLRRHVHGA